MSRSLFDPEGGQTEQTGSRFTPPNPISNLSAEITDPEDVTEPDVPLDEALQKLADEEAAHDSEKEQKNLPD